jgi:hypothetical protein
MAAFCGNCGTQVGDGGQFCPKCGAPTGDTSTKGPWSASPPAAAAGPAVPAAAAGPAVPAAPPNKMSAGVKLLIAAVVILFVCVGIAVAGMAYAAHRVSQKFHEIADGQLDASSPAGAGAKASAGHASGDPCRYLGKEDVGTAIGVEIVRTEAADGGCNFYAKGDQAEMSAKHVTAMMAKNGADAKTQKMIQNISSGMFKTFQEEQPHSGDGSGTVVVFNYQIDDNAAAAQMNLNRKAMQHVGGPATTDLSGIGDEAFVTADSSIMARKGNKLIRIMYMTCPCNLDQVKPLAQKLAAAL